MSRPTTPTTPIRPPRSERRLTLESISSTSFSPSSSEINIENTPPLPNLSSSSTYFTPASSSSENDHLPQTPTTAKTPTPNGKPKLSNRKSTSSIKRKPVPLTSEDLVLDLTQLPSRKSNDTDSPLTASSTYHYGSNVDPPRYILPVDLPVSYTPQPTSSNENDNEIISEAGPSSSVTNIDFSASRPPSYAIDHPNAEVQPGVSSSTSTTAQTGIRHEGLYYDPTAGLGASSTFTLPSTDELPCYAEETQTEPKTLAKALWKWGFLCPFLWIIGMCILWIPLKPVEEESDPEKAQKLEEMIVILRKTEIKYAKRCAYGCLGFSVLLAVIIVVAILLSKLL